MGRKEPYLFWCSRLWFSTFGKGSAMSKVNFECWRAVCVVWFWMSVFSDCLIICLLLNLILGATSSEFHSISSTSESPQNQEELKKWKQKTKIVETEKLKGKIKMKRCIKILWKVVVNSNNHLLFDVALKNYLNAVM